MGYFIIDEAPRKLENITVTSLDRMIRFDKYINYYILDFPMTVGALLTRICTIYGFEMGTNANSLPNSSYMIEKTPSDGEFTYRQLISWIAEITGTCAFFDWNGKLVLKWYEEK